MHVLQGFPKKLPTVLAKRELWKAVEEVSIPYLKRNMHPRSNAVNDGLRLFEQDHVCYIERVEPRLWKGSVHSSSGPDVYCVNVFMAGESIARATCTCPVQSKTHGAAAEYCKHIAAFMVWIGPQFDEIKARFGEPDFTGAGGGGVAAAVPGSGASETKDGKRGRQKKAYCPRVNSLHAAVVFALFDASGNAMEEDALRVQVAADTGKAGNINAALRTLLEEQLIVKSDERGASVYRLTETGREAKSEIVYNMEKGKKKKKARKVESADDDDDDDGDDAAATGGGGGKAYKPKKRGGGYAMLIALSRAKGGLTIAELQAQAEPFCDTPMQPQNGKFYSGYSSAATLKKHALVRVQKVSGLGTDMYFLTDAGRALAATCEAIEAEAEMDRRRALAPSSAAASAAIARASPIVSTARSPAPAVVVASPPSAAIKWECSRCTLLNSATANVCVVCEAPRPVAQVPPRPAVARAMPPAVAQVLPSSVVLLADGKESAVTRFFFAEF
jgi:hypothetical protein